MARVSRTFTVFSTAVNTAPDSISSLILAGNTLYGTAEYGGSTTGFGSLLPLTLTVQALPTLYFFRKMAVTVASETIPTAKGFIRLGLTFSEQYPLCDDL